MGGSGKYCAAQLPLLRKGSDDDPEAQRRLSEFQQKLQELSWSVGRNLLMDYRWAGTDPK